MSPKSSSAVLLLGICCGPISAQVNVTSVVRAGSVALTVELAAKPKTAITGFPYSAIKTSGRTLPNGTHMAYPSEKVYRDADGRTRWEREYKTYELETPVTLVDIIDPVEGYRYVLDPVNRVAHRIPIHVVSQPARRQPRRCDMAAKSAPSPVRDGITSYTELLGRSSIEGIAVCGERQVITYPTGSTLGNDRPVATVLETWRSAEDIDAIVLMKDSTPDRIITTSGLKSVNFTEPDPALFQVPDGYRIEDSAPPYTIVVPSKFGHPAVRTHQALTGMPFSAEIWFDSDEVAGDGTHLSHHSATPEYRDWMGRTRRDVGGGNIEILDAVAGYRYVLNPDQHVAHRYPARFSSKPASEASAPQSKAPTAAGGGLESLGLRNIDGLNVYGLRSVLRYPPGTFSGNDKTIETAVESWISPQLGINVLMKVRAPEGRDTTATLHNLKLAEPDAALFRVPDDYRVLDETAPPPAPPATAATLK
jgi:hypothetical protein